MVDEIENVQSSETADGQTPPPSGSTKPEPTPVIPQQAPAGAPANWQDILNGFKGAATKQQNRADRLAAEKDELYQQKSELEVKLQTETQAAKAKIAAAEQTAAQAAAEAAALRNKEAVGKKIKTEYGVLADLWEADALNLTGLEGEALDNHLKNLAGLIETKTDKRQDNKFSGSTPPPPPQGNAPSKTAAELKAEADKALKDEGPRSANYRAAMEKLATHLVNESRK